MSGLHFILQTQAKTFEFFCFRSADNSFSEEIKGDKGRYRSALGEIKADSFSSDERRVKRMEYLNSSPKLG
jgi:hypothetical protein